MSEKKYLAKIIAVDNEGLQMISACCAGAITNVANIKYLKENKVFLLSMERTKVEAGQEDKKVNSICKFDFISNVKSKNIVINEYINIAKKYSSPKMYTFLNKVLDNTL